ncbi:E3 ubiquitin-protein ligase WAV3-like [Silene latifolia]|uniref:E3 ubiquitin-protein ligase WAV3-like n=1 Tax=Silene latifolia TaxID=37657 RepID=UPI003D76ED18
MVLDKEEQRCGVDIVVVLDLGGFIHGKKLKKLKTWTNFFVKKLSPIDRLSIVTFSKNAGRLCPLTRMNEYGKDNVELLINKLKGDGYTNITAGLQTALNILAQRRQKAGRTSAVLLMSDGKLTNGCDHPSTVDVSDVPVYTIGLGNDHDSQLLQDIATRSYKGTYSIADMEEWNLNIAFSSCQEGLLNVFVQDLQLTITQLGSDIQDVRAGNYNQTRDNESVTISFGNVYNYEKFRTTVFLSLPAVKEQTAIDILKVALSYRYVPSILLPLFYCKQFESIVQNALSNCYCLQANRWAGFVN